MPAKPAFTEAQIRVLRETAKKVRKRFRTQEEFALALGITQPSLSSLLQGKWRPGVTTAKAIAHLEQVSLEDLVGPYSTPSESPAEAPRAKRAPSEGRYPNLEACVRFYAGTKSWAAWTLAAAREGFFGDSDLAPPAWPERLDSLETALEKIRVAGRRT